MKSLEVVAAVIQHQDKILCALKGEHKYPYLSNKYEFPGGKVEAEETLKQALIREIKEELNLDIEITEYLLTVEHAYPNFNIELATFMCVTKTIEELALSEHLDVQWCSINELEQLDWAAADIPIVKYLLDNKTATC
ncbi:MULTISPECIES: (deoxy)nucleoside triphosphate pyrophosphohydrolase [Acinetobacter calcoaceticus/baumannii complex]|uniref:(deoxy)nucleoside triphosphate pyrophosphohydrolase n=1 Tax=Acinetobacter calcoaceticus/baumannii complex TaxID=909768 RepID=UPI00044CBE77|nr:MULTISPECIES: (deoxy)nucleoside triphosphate pyrophosphohydrolase [Acinetobacter calcoaceticus/baumannii complex]EXB96324.1 putative CTP pyrophosphohydrolase [Acinetobacter baumannii 342950]MCU4398718.1 (deoxy)nucleoside triphosphate pyrophosphohydrolase [Acinetobacter pittii]MCU4402813.1 (deoxy)nucleoside triphosphate pyrophosphohydrolase [Acinetobacter pittii]MCU4465224.1 (deoxy)nucleoside triphosphate pyrophosphohydrolase [Acinetobacter pittii]MDH2518507.1 (deoxy)nucleoside triphosphate 